MRERHNKNKTKTNKKHSTPPPPPPFPLLHPSKKRREKVDLLKKQNKIE